jgi:hypothetical protein
MGGVNIPPRRIPLPRPIGQGGVSRGWVFQAHNQLLAVLCDEHDMDGETEDRVSMGFKGSHLLRHYASIIPC